jgi:hypothetical protein
MKLQVRKIGEADLPVLTALLHRGFPVPRRFWEAGLAGLVARSVLAGMPRFDLWRDTAEPTFRRHTPSGK